MDRDSSNWGYGYGESFDEETGKRRISIVYVAALGDQVDLLSQNVRWVNMEEAFNMSLFMDHSQVAQLMMRNL